MSGRTQAWEKLQMDLYRANFESVKGKINIRHYTIWMENWKSKVPMLCNCLGPGSPSTMCCEDYYREAFNPLEWLPAPTIFFPHFYMNPKKYWKLRKKNMIFLAFWLLLSSYGHPGTKAWTLLDE